ncbi:glycosyltransferase family 4 protein [Salinibacter ruber]|uniref:glycosyltransferase family 4 protein n=1 Tax=Salinibacter ruber TaxID=146919 RepID=UPI00216A543B|nr:glycosyltransferase family 4 protein [Salinibacter ruber]MCS3638159.1 glycosyltransferase involved in cell wall biosynthesis [Salinibacter ruber]
MDKDETVLFIPYGKGNKYHDLLTESIETLGWETIEGDANVKKYFPLLYYARTERFSVVHVVWTNPFFLVKEFSNYYSINLFATLIMALAFVIDVCIVKASGRKIVWTVHNKYNHEKKFKVIDRGVSIILSRIADRMTVECEKAKEVVSSLYLMRNKKKIKVIPEGNYIKGYPDNISRDEAQKEVGVSTSKLVYLFFGQIREYKGVPHLIKSFRQIRDKQVDLLIAGKPYNENLKDKVVSLSSKDYRVKSFLKFIPDSKIQVYFNAADVVVLPYRDILTSGTVMLAMSYAKPVVAPKIGCIPRLLHKQTELLYQNSVTNLQNSLQQCIKHSSLPEVGQQNKEVAKKYTWDMVSSQTVDLYNSI